MKRQIEGKEYELIDLNVGLCEKCIFHDESKEEGERCKITHLHEVQECITEGGIWKEVSHD